VTHSAGILPFTVEEFFGLFARYNADIWPVQLFAYLLGLAAVALLLSRNAAAGRLIAVILALMWGWTGAAYHLGYFTAINGAALFFGVFFVAEAAAFAVYAFSRPQFILGFDTKTTTGVLFIVYAALAYPLIGLGAGHPGSELPAFGVTPCPVTIFTFGLLLLAAQRPPTWLWPIPLAWSVVGGSAALLLQVPQDWPLVVSGIASLLLWYGARTRRHGAAPRRNTP
jgi:hypothetical protein